MAQLSSPGVSVTVVDESFYTPAAPGTVPLIIVASAANKENSAGTGIAPGTLKANAGKVYLLTSQMDLGNTFGIPYFQTDAENNPVHAGEINEYGLQAAYSFLGVSSRAYVARADVDLSQLTGSSSAPGGLPVDGAYWWDTATTTFGVFEWNAQPYTATNGQSFVNQIPSVINNVAYTTGASTYAPLASYGAIGSYAIVTVTGTNTLWYKHASTNSDGTAGSSTDANNAGWVLVGSDLWQASRPTATGTNASPTLTSSNTFIINGHSYTGVTTLGALAAAINTAALGGVTASVQNGYLNLYSTGADIVISGTGVSGAGTPGFTSGTYLAPQLSMSPHYQIPQYGSLVNPSTVNGFPTGSLWIKTTPVNLGANWDIEKYNASSANWIRQPVAALYPDNQSAMAALDPKGGGINIPVGQVYVKYNNAEQTVTVDGIVYPATADFTIYQRLSTGATSVTSNTVTLSSGSYSFTVAESQVGSSTLTSPVTVAFTATGNATNDAHALLAALQSALVNTLITSTYNTNNTITISHAAGGDIRLVDGTGSPLAAIFAVNDAGTGTTNFYSSPNGLTHNYIVTAWASQQAGTSLVTPSATAPTTTPADGTLWYNSSVDDVDILINTGSAWVGYISGATVVNGGVGGPSTDPMGPIVSASQPTLQSDGTALAHGDLWIDSSDTENWPTIYKYNYLTKKWVLVDSTDHTTQNGIVFADARWSTQPNSGAQTGAGAPSSIVSLLSSNFVDFDCPDPALYPRGMMLYNLRRSSFNVKRYVSGYVDITAQNTRLNEAMTYYYPDRWVSDAANDYRGVGVFGRKSQRAVVVQALNALIEGNQQIRDEDSRVFDIMSCPGYLETLPALDSLNNDRGLLSFIVADSPARLTADATSLSNWANNVDKATGDGEYGLINTSSNAAVYYPWGYTTDLKGNNIVVPPSHIMLRTIALSDNVAYPWFAPAGVRRGGVTNASSVGYVDSQTGEFVPVALNQGQRDTLAAVHVNPITYIGGTGLVVYGQYTRQLVASALDRINVARLVIYLRYQLNAIAKPYIFEPNDTITRNEIKQQIEKLLLNLTGERALYDYVVVCDTSNNTPSRIDASELYVDIAIEPVKAVEFIYIPLRLENTGAIKGLSK
jgi:Phage tail sheath C-terminal domain/Flagellin hook IN motif